MCVSWERGRAGANNLNSCGEEGGKKTHQPRNRIIKLMTPGETSELVKTNSEESTGEIFVLQQSSRTAAGRAPLWGNKQQQKCYLRAESGGVTKSIDTARPSFASDNRKPGNSKQHDFELDIITNKYVREICFKSGCVRSDDAYYTRAMSGNNLISFIKKKMKWWIFF